MTRASPECKVDISALIEKMKDHLIRAEIARKNDEWMPALRELNTLILAGADGSQSVTKCYFRIKLCTVNYSGL